MKDALLDIVKVVSVLPFETIKVTGADGEVTIQSRLLDDDNGTVIFSGKLIKPIAEFEGVFGLGNIPMLTGLTNVESFRNGKISLKHQEKNGLKLPEQIVFEKDGFGKASYRLTGEKGIPAQAKSTGTIEWDTVIVPTKQKIMDLAQLAGIYSSQEKKFSVKTENRQLKFLIGDEDGATHKAQMVFDENATGTVKPNHIFNINAVLSILKLNNNAKTSMKISNQGFIQIEVDTGVGVYTYILCGAN